MNTDPLTQKKAKRFRFLNGLYEKTDGNEEDIVDMWELGAVIGDRKSTRLNSSHVVTSRMPSSA